MTCFDGVANEPITVPRQGGWQLFGVLAVVAALMLLLPG